MYIKREVDLRTLLLDSGEPSLNALRERATAGILVYVRSNGPTQFYDEQLSGLRCRAARSCKVPGVTWTKIESSVKSQTQWINDTAIKMLNDDAKDVDITAALATIIRTRL